MRHDSWLPTEPMPTAYRRQRSPFDADSVVMGGYAASHAQITLPAMLGRLRATLDETRHPFRARQMMSGPRTLRLTASNVVHSVIWQDVRGVDAPHTTQGA